MLDDDEDEDEEERKIGPHPDAATTLIFTDHQSKGGFQHDRFQLE